MTEVLEQPRAKTKGGSAKGYQPLDAQGRLLQERPDGGKVRWSGVPVSKGAAFDLFAPFGERERAVLGALEARRYLTVEQIARRFYGSYKRAYDMVNGLFMRRFVARFESASRWVGRSLMMADHPPHIYFIDWNGHYLLDDWRGVEDGASSWRADTIGVPNGGTGHLLGVNEIWSLLYKAARTTQGRESGPCLSLAWREVGAARVQYGNKARQVIMPDAEALLRTRPSSAQRGAEEDGASWRDVALGSWPGPQELGSAQDGIRYRTLLVEYETGANGERYVIEKIKGYNALLAQEAVWKQRYGLLFPRVLVLVREREQVTGMWQLWRKHYNVKLVPGQRVCPVLVTSLYHLRAAEQQPDSILGVCWRHALDPEPDPATGEPRWLNLADALGMPGL